MKRIASFKTTAKQVVVYRGNGEYFVSVRAAAGSKLLRAATDEASAIQFAKDRL